MKKDYDRYISPQNNPQIKSKRLVHLLSSSCLVVNLIVFAILLPDIRAWTLGLAVVFLGYAILMLFDERKSEWAWWSIILGIVISIAVSICYTLLFSLYFYFAVMGVEIILSSVIFYVFKKN